MKLAFLEIPPLMLGHEDLFTVLSLLSFYDKHKISFALF